MSELPADIEHPAWYYGRHTAVRVGLASICVASVTACGGGDGTCAWKATYNDGDTITNIYNRTGDVQGKITLSDGKKFVSFVVYPPGVPARILNLPSDPPGVTEPFSASEPTTLDFPFGSRRLVAKVVPAANQIVTMCLEQ